MSREQLPYPDRALHILEHEIPDDFTDDGCSNSPDSLWGFSFRDACRIHDWRYCTRCHLPGSMTQSARHKADRELAQNIRARLPKRWRWVRYLYYFMVWKEGGTSAFDSCGPDAGGQCRHGQPMPSWMKRRMLR